MATVHEVETTIGWLIGQLEGLDSSSRSLLPSRRLIQATCPDLDMTWHALWANQEVGELTAGPPPQRPDITISVRSDDLLALVNGDLTFRSAWQAGRIKLEASMTDLLRLRTAL